MRVSSLGWLFGLCAFGVAAAPPIKTAFPRLAGVVYSAPHNYADPAVANQLARLDLVIVDFHASWGPEAARQAAVMDLKRRKPELIVLDYVMMERMSNKNRGVAPYRDKLDKETWWLYESGSAGDRVSPDENFFMTNYTSLAPADAAGQQWNQWFAERIYADSWDGVPALDGYFEDNMFWAPRENGDWDRDGDPDSRHDPEVQARHRMGHLGFHDRVSANWPTALRTGNVGDWGRPEARVPEYDQKLDGGLMEGYIGAWYSVERKGWDQLMASYRKVMGLLRPPKLGIFNVWADPSDYQTFRYGFASALMDDGYLALSDSTKTGGRGIYRPRVPWFDEYDLGGRRTTSWLGAAIDAPPTEPWQDGVYRRRFEHGMAIVNPKGNGARVVTVEPGYRRIPGTQAPEVNNGEPASAIALRDRDGILLVADPAAVPAGGAATSPTAAASVLSSPAYRHQSSK